MIVGIGLNESPWTNQTLPQHCLQNGKIIDILLTSNFGDNNE